MKTPTPRRAPLALAVLAAASSAGFAQSAGDQVVTMNEFQVSEKSPNAYIASETMTGSRINTRIIDLPYSIVNLTQEFFHDYNVHVLDENMTYIGGLTGINIGGSFNLRGFASTSQLRDGFYRLGRYGLSNIQEIEIIRGPNAAVYGRSSPGGMINFISLPPAKLNQQTVDVAIGGYQQQNFNFKSTGSFDSSGKTYYVLNLNQNSRSFPGGVSHIRNNEDFVAVQHDFNEDTHLKLSAEYYLQVQHAPQGGAPLITRSRTADAGNAATLTYVGYDYALASINPYGPNSELNRGSDTFELTFDHRFNDVFSTRLGAYRFMARRWDYNQNTGWGTINIPLAGSPITTVRGAVPSRGEIMEDGGGFQQDLVAHHFLFNRKVDNKTLLTVDLNDYYRWDPTWEFGPNNDATIVAWTANPGRTVTLAPGVSDGRQDLVPVSPIGYFPTWYSTPNLEIFGTGNDKTGGTAANGGTLTRRRTISLGGNLRQQSTLLDGRLIVFAGLRVDNVLFSQRDYTVAFASVGVENLAPGTGGANQPGGSVVRRYEHQRNPSGGFNYQLTGEANHDGLHVYGSYSTAYFVDQTSRPAVIAASTYAPFTAEGYDYGIKGTYFQSRLNFTFGGYYDKEYNVLVNDLIEISPGNYMSVPQQDGNQLVRGFESDASWVVTSDESLVLGESYGHVNAIYTNFGSSNPEVKGRSAQNIAPYNGSVYAKYTFTHGPLKGLSLNPLVTFVGSIPTQSPSAGDTVSTAGGVAVVTAHTDQWKIRLPSFTVWNFSMTYDLPRFWGAKWDHQITLTLNNVFDKSYLKTSALAADRRSFIVQYQISRF